MTRKPVRLLVLGVMVWLTQAAQAELVLEITKGQGDATPIAIVPFGWNGNGPKPYEVAEVISADLARTGWFAPIPQDRMLQKPTARPAIDFGDWRMLKAQAIVIGQISQTGPDQYSVEFRVFDVVSQKQLLAYQLPSSGAKLRRTAHRIADYVFEELTGIKGVAATRIAYVSVTGTHKNPEYRLIVADADGENAQVKRASSKPIMSPAWSPDGRKIAYVSFENNRSEVWVQRIEGTKGARRRVSAREGVNSAPVWSPDGKFIALSLSRGDGNLDIYKIELANQMLTRLTSWPSIETEPSWSDDGQYIYFTSDRSGGPQIYKMPAAGGAAERVTFEGNYNARPRISPDGSRLGVVHNDRGNYRIALVDVERSYMQVLSEGRLDESPSFAPNGEVLIFASRDGGKGYLAMVSADGRFEQRLGSSTGDVREPAWSPFVNF